MPQGMAFFLIMIVRTISLLFLSWQVFATFAQNTVGLISYDNDLAFDGHNLLFPHNQPNVYLLNNCGEIVHTWPDSAVVPGNSVYITTEGKLLKCKRKTTSAVNDPIWAGGGGETVEILSWENDLIASFTLNDSLYRLHHDIAELPNGNILMISWQLKTLEQSIAAGRDPSTLAQDKLWSETIFEWNPNLDSIVWEWNVWDHLIQDFDPTKDNFGTVSEHPELININYDTHNGHPDWLHINSIDYNITLDQIMLSVPYFDELWVIDHSTSTQEAASHSGGNSGRGGDLLYRWGNPRAYNQGDSSDQQLFFPHDIHWQVSDAQVSESDFGRIVLFNNRVGADFSTVNTLIPTFEQGQYVRSNGTYLPTQFERIIRHPGDDLRSYSNSLSSAQLLPNGNFLVCAGRWGYNYEVTPQDQLVWEYITPFVRGQRAMQGDSTLMINNNLTFRIKRYPITFEGFNGRDLDAKGFIELSPDTSFCNNIISSTDDLQFNSFSIFPNPASDILNVGSEEKIGKIFIFDYKGNYISEHEVNGYKGSITIETLAPGLYIARSHSGRIGRFVKI